MRTIKLLAEIFIGFWIVLGAMVILLFRKDDPFNDRMDKFGDYYN